MNYGNLFLLFSLALLSACARPGTPTGGPKDTEPPKVDSTRSTPNFTTRFNQKKIEITFDEWVILKDAGAQLVISPPVAKKPEILIKGKTVVVAFDQNEQFRENATYTVNFGTAVRDLHEENPAQDLRFVFSTGDVIDSLRLSGIVTDAYTGEAVENVAVMLYDQPDDDSIPAKERPYYFSRTNKSGQFTISNLRAGSFKCVAVEDGNQNLRWESGNERLAFPDSLVVVADSAIAPLALRLFKNAEKARLLERQTKTYGQLQLKYTARVDSLNIRSTVEGMNLWKVQYADSVVIWYNYPTDTIWNLLAGADTVTVKAGSREDFLKTRRLSWGDVASAIPGSAGSRRKTLEAPPQEPARDSAASVSKTVTLRPGKLWELPFNAPIQQTDTTLWILKKDSLILSTPLFVPDDDRPDLLRMTTPLPSAGMYQLLLAPGAVTDVYGLSNRDTLLRIVNIPDEKQLGGLNLTISELTPGGRYVLQLYNDKLLEEEYQFTAPADTQRVAFTQLPTAAFTVRLIEDVNNDGYWTTGDYYAGRQPERIFTKKLEPLRANWEVEAELSAAQSRGKRDRF
jgi:hypothetical protein